MANNQISEWLVEHLYTPVGGDEAQGRIYAAKLDRLVEAAKRVVFLRVRFNNCHCGWCVSGDELAAALRDIELEIK